jgi:two-component system response regulator (stage 0 sporulation protein F)
MQPQLIEKPAQQIPLPGIAASPKKLRVLLVEDDPDMRRLVATVLVRDGCEVIQARDGVGMLRRIESELWSERPEHFDVILSDIQMPDLTAIEVLEALRYRDITTPVVLMTAYGSDQMRTEARSLGAIALLDKPIDWLALRAAIREAAAA